jgi:hypothetical protein
VIDPGRRVVHPIVDYVRRAIRTGRLVTVLIGQVEPRHQRYQVLHNQRGILLAAQVRAQTDAVVAFLPFRVGR